MGKAAAVKGDIKKSVHYFERALDLAPEKNKLKKLLVELYTELGAQAYDNKQPGQTMRYLQAALHFDPDNQKLRQLERKLKKSK